MKRYAKKYYNNKHPIGMDGWMDGNGMKHPIGIGVGHPRACRLYSIKKLPDDKSFSIPQ
jgi:hypothetical protein